MSHHQPRKNDTATPITEIALGSLPVLLKREEFVPSGSHKGRPTKFIADALRRNGKFYRVTGKKPQFVVPSSGNFGIGFAFHTQYDDIEVLVITDALSSVESREALRAYDHVRVEVVDQPDESGSHLKARMALLANFLAKNPNATVINQYCERCVPLAYELSLAKEIDEQTDGQVGMIVLPVGTGGTLNGVLKYVQKHRRNWTVIAADARGSRLFHDPAGCKRHFPGYGNGQPTALIEEISRYPYSFGVVHVDDEHAALACHSMWRKHDLMFGPSSGASIAAIEMVLRYRPELIPDAGHIVAVMPDSGRNYMSSLFSEDWLMANGLGKVVGFASV